MLRNIAFGAELGGGDVASTKPRWLRHMIATPSPGFDALARQRVRERVGALVQLAEA